MSGFKYQDSRQVIVRQALSTSIGTAASTTLDVVLETIDAQMVNIAGLQKIQNKTIGSSNAGLLANTLQFQEIATPSTDPLVNTLALYPKSDGHFYSLNSSGMEAQIGAGSALPVGATVSAFLTLTQFQSQSGAGWVLSEGQTVSGSAYETLTGGSSVTASASASVNATGSVITFSTLVLSTTGTTHTNNQLTNVASVAGLAVGELISGTGIPATTTVSSIDQYTFALPGTPDQYTFAVHSANQYVFTVSPANATAGATYTNNGQTFTVDTTITGATILNALGTGNPTASGTLTLASGTGDATITFSAFTFAGANATSGATYTNNTQTFTVSSTITGGTSLTAIGTGDPTVSGTLTKTSGTGDTTIVFTSFAFGAHNATAGTTYTNNGQTFTVVTTIDDQTTLVCTGTGVPTNSGTLTLASGTGDATIPFTSVSANLTMSQNSASSASITVLFSNFVTSTTGDLTISSNMLTNLASTVGIANSQVISVTGLSPYATVTAVTITTVPDCRGVFLRGKNNGATTGNNNPDGDLPLGTYQADVYASHTHNMQNVSGVNVPYQAGPDGGSPGTFPIFSPQQFVGNAGGNETRSKNVTVNTFIRIN